MPSPKTNTPTTAPASAPPRLQLLPPAYFFAPDLEREINRLDSVTSAKVLSTGSEIDEIHVLAPTNILPKKVVRDIESLLLVRFGIRVDHRCISVVQIENDMATYPVNSRPRIQSVTSDDRLVRLILAVDDRTVIGQAERTDRSDDLGVTARAVVHAIEQMLQTPGILSVVKTRIVDLEEYQIVVIVLRWLFADQQEMLVGASMVSGELTETVARAALDAVNRRLVRFQTSRT